MDDEDEGVDDLSYFESTGLTAGKYTILVVVCTLSSVLSLFGSCTIIHLAQQHIFESSSASPRNRLLLMLKLGDIFGLKLCHTGAVDLAYKHWLPACEWKYCKLYDDWLYSAVFWPGCGLVELHFEHLLCSVGAVQSKTKSGGPL